MNIQRSGAFPVGREVPPNNSKSSKTEAFTQHRVVVQHHRSRWMMELAERFKEITELEAGWDGYNGQAVSFPCATFAATILERLCLEDVPAPSIVPGSDGTLQLEWHMNGFDIEIDVLAPLKVVASRSSLDGSVDEELELDVDFTPIADWVKLL